MTDRADAPAKLNLDLRIIGRDCDGYHRLRSLVQTIDRFDTLEVEVAEEDHLQVSGEPVTGDNLIWRAVSSLRRRFGDTTPLRFALEKRIPVAAGLGGGSADAAAALLLTARLLQVEPVTDLAQEIGADVPFFLEGGRAMMEGRGERITPVECTSDFAVAVVTPPFHLSTAAVYASYDRLGDGQTRAVGAEALPPSLRERAPLINDLEPAARALLPELGDWIAELENGWGRPVLLTGSGPSLFSFFVDGDEARSAVHSATGRVAFSALPIEGGVRL